MFYLMKNTDLAIHSGTFNMTNRTVRVSLSNLS